MQGEGQMGIFGGVGPVLGGSAGGKDYSLATMLECAEHKQSGSTLSLHLVPQLRFLFHSSAVTSHKAACQ